MIRRATSDDAAAIGELFVRVRDEMTYLPRIVDEHRPLLGGWFLERDEIWVSEREGVVVGFAGLHDDVLTHLYVDNGAQNAGVGTAMLDHAKSQRPGRLELWVFKKNAGARRFYERHGFRLVRITEARTTWRRSPTPCTNGSRGPSRPPCRCRREASRHRIGTDTSVFPGYAHRVGGGRRPTQGREAVSAMAETGVR